MTVNFTLTYWDIYAAFLGMAFLLTTVMSASNHWEWLKAKLWRKETAYWILGIASFALFLPAIWEIGKIVTGHSDVFDKDPRGYAILLAAVVGTPFIIWRTYIAQKQSYTSEQGLITDRITKAVEQLGAEKTVWENDMQSSKPNLEVRLGGIYSLERIAQDSERDHTAVMEILCAYIRGNSPSSSAIPFTEGTEINSDEWDSWFREIGSLRFDLQAVLDVIGRRTDRQLKKEGREKYQLDFRARSLSEDQINSMFGDSTTRLPEYMENMPEGWPHGELSLGKLFSLWQTTKEEAGLP